MKKFFIPTLVIVLVSLAGVYFYTGSCRITACFRMQGLESFRRTDLYQDDSDSYRALFSADPFLLRLELIHHLTPERARNITDQKVAGIKTLYVNSFAPYPGMITREIECSKEYQAQFSTEKKNGFDLTIVELYSNDRLTAGSCVPESAVYRSLTGIFYCSGSKELIQAELFVPTADFTKNPKIYQDQIRSLECK